MSIEKMSSIQGGRFWGNATKCTECYGGIKICQEKFFVLWIPFEKASYAAPC